MTQSRTSRWRATAVMLIAGCLVLSACMLSPGKFASTFDLRRDGRFTFTYAGEIHILALSKLAEMNHSNRDNEPFKPSPCFADDSTSERRCTEAEIAEQRSGWEEEQQATAHRRQREAESMKAVLGGIDPADPKAAEEFAQRLRRQQGWRKVIYKGEGLYEVDFAISGRLDHDFTFPVIERFPSANVFVQAVLRADGAVRIDAPGYAPMAAGEPYRGLMQGALLSEGKQNAPRLPEMDGTFTLRTDGEIMANNTDEGPQASTTGKELVWTVNARTAEPPTALIRIAAQAPVPRP